MATQQTESLGVARANFIFSKLGWLFREQPTHDYGIDAHVEIFEERYPTGKLIAIQIKSGNSFFGEQADGGFVFRTEDKHVEYWLGHSMPVILVLYNPTTDRLYWQHINRETVINTGKNWKIVVPEANILDENLRVKSLTELAQPVPYIRRLNKLRLDKTWMQMLIDGQEVVIEFDDWVNKSLPRFQATISGGRQKHVWPLIYAPGMDVEDLLEHYVPWADFESDADAHREGSEGLWSAECYSNTDSETGEVYYTQTFEEWYEPPTGKLFAVDSDGETRSYRLILELNELGHTFLQLDAFLEQEGDFEKGTFTLEDVLPGAKSNPAAKPLVKK